MYLFFLQGSNEMVSIREEAVTVEQVLNQGLEVRDICTMEKDQLLQIQSRVGVGGDWGVCDFDTRTKTVCKKQHTTRGGFEIGNNNARGDFKFEKERSS